MLNHKKKLMIFIKKLKNFNRLGIVWVMMLKSLVEKIVKGLTN
jgi:hypothetical protein